MIMSLSKPRDHIPMDIPPPHNGYGILPTPIPCIYALVLPPTFYKGKHLESCMSQTSRVSSIPPPLKEEKKPMSIDPQPSQVSTKTKMNSCTREC